MTYQQTLDYLYTRLPMYHRLGPQAYKADLGNTIALCNLLGNPQDSFKSIHVTGTNGKGSVSHMIASVLQAAGYRTGLYTSPHLKDFRERIKVNGKKIPQRYVSRFIEKHRSETEQIEPSFFELTVGLAFDYFRDRQVDFAVVEVGLGGRLDSTNIIHPILSVITNVSFDHMQFLGDTLEKIATEKAGIIKPGVPVVIGESQEEVKAVFTGTARERKSEIVYADRQFSIGFQRLAGKLRNKRAIEVLSGDTTWLRNIRLPLAGQYQLKNVLTVLAVCDRLHGLGLDLSGETIRLGLEQVVKRTGLQGRWQILAKKPLTICDTGHNEGGLREVLSQIETTPHDHLHFVFGVVNDKVLAPVLALLPADATYYFCKPGIPRGLDARTLQTEALAAGLSGEAYPSVAEALAAAQKNAAENDLVFIGGSTFVVAEVVK